MRLIDADLLKRVICQDQCEKPDGCGGSCEMTDYIENAPTVEAEPVRHGHWQMVIPSYVYECSACGQYVNTADISAYKFCHHCGAKMDEVSE